MTEILHPYLECAGLERMILHCVSCCATDEPDGSAATIEDVYNYLLCELEFRKQPQIDRDSFDEALAACRSDRWDNRNEAMHQAHEARS